MAAEVKSLLRDNETVSNCCSTMGSLGHELKALTSRNAVQKIEFSVNINSWNTVTTPTSCEVELLTGVGCIFCSRAPKQYMGRHAAS